MAAFDAGLVTVLQDGTVAASPMLSEAGRRVLYLSDTLRLKLQPQHGIYLAWHRTRVFRAMAKAGGAKS
jgi:hypothetical protein